MKNTNQFFKIITCIAVTLCMLASQPSLSLSQDSVAPTIEFIPSIYTKKANQTADEERFEVEVRDNVGVSRVVLYFRLPGQSNYQNLSMQPENENSDIYVAKLKFADQNIDRIEYYYDAEDSSGNFSLKGQSFSPLIRIVKETITAPVSDSGTIEAKRSRTLYYVIGAVVLGAIAVALSGGSDGPDDSCDESGCPVSFRLDAVQ